MHTFRIGGFVALALAGWIALGPVAACAHAIVVSSVPAAGAVVHDKSGRVTVRFNSRIDPVRSRLMLVRADGTAITLELTDTLGPDTLAATVGELAPGSYRLRWQVLAIDGHITRGDIPFTVAP